jgi:hypothetical protein
MLKTFCLQKRQFGLPEEASPEGGEQSLEESERGGKPRAKCKSLLFLACQDAKKVTIPVA